MMISNSHNYHLQDYNMLIKLKISLTCLPDNIKKSLLNLDNKLIILLKLMDNNLKLNLKTLPNLIDYLLLYH